MDDFAFDTVGATGPGELGYHVLVPDRARARAAASLVVAVHGISLNAREQLESFAAHAAKRGQVVMAPCFDTAEDRDYQRLGRRGRGRRADLALDDAIQRLSDETGIRFGRRFFFGYSGGGQFVHRYLMTHPDRVDAAVVAAAGWYTFPDARLAYPLGLRIGASLVGARMEPGEFLRVPVLTVVGELDVERDESIRSTATVDERQGADRLERARRWVAAMRAAARARNIAARHDLVFLEGAGHSFADCVARGLAHKSFDFFDSVELDPVARADRDLAANPHRQEWNPK